MKGYDSEINTLDSIKALNEPDKERRLKMLEEVVYKNYIPNELIFLSYPKGTCDEDGKYVFNQIYRNYYILTSNEYIKSRSQIEKNKEKNISLLVIDKKQVEGLLKTYDISMPNFFIEKLLELIDYNLIIHLDMKVKERDMYINIYKLCNKKI